MLGHHSLVTPIDWKLFAPGGGARQISFSHHSLVTPIDWKPGEVGPGESPLAGDTY